MLSWTFRDIFGQKKYPTKEAWQARKDQSNFWRIETVENSG